MPRILEKPEQPSVLWSKEFLRNSSGTTAFKPWMNPWASKSVNYHPLKQVASLVVHHIQDLSLLTRELKQGDCTNSNLGVSKTINSGSVCGSFEVNAFSNESSFHCFGGDLLVGRKCISDGFNVTCFIQLVKNFLI